MDPFFHDRILKCELFVVVLREKKSTVKIRKMRNNVVNENDSKCCMFHEFLDIWWS